MTCEKRSGLTRAEAREKMFDLMCANARVLREDLSEQKRLGEDLGLDSFDLVSILSAAEGEFEISISDERFSQFSTVGDVFDEFWKKLASGPTDCIPGTTPLE